MFGIRFIKAQPTSYLMQFRGGKLVRQGAGLAFFYYAPTTSLVSIPMESAEAPFILEEVTSDFQTVTVQGQITYRVADAKQLASLMNFTLDAEGRKYVSEDPQKLPSRLLNVVMVIARVEMQKLTLRQSLQASESVAQAIQQGLATSGEIKALGIEVLGASILAIKPRPETAKALEADAREQLLRKADEAIYARRNSAVEQERTIKENELNTEIAVENKKRQIREAQMDADRAVQEKRHALEQADMQAKVELEDRRRAFVATAAENARSEADSRAYGLAQIMQALGQTDPRVLQALASSGMQPEQIFAAAFQEIAGRADKIGELNISPDLLRELKGPKR